MDFSFYQEKTGETAVYPEEDAVGYLALGVTGEAGEVAEKVKKSRRDGESLEGVKDELGDLLWYMARLADELDMDFGDVAERNLEKVESRAERGKIQGSGDDR